MGTVGGGLLGCLLGGLFARSLGLSTTGSAFFLALDWLSYFAVAGCGFIGAIGGRELGVLLARLFKKK